MADFERGPTSEYAVTWKNGHIDHVHAHQVMWDDGTSFFASYLNGCLPQAPGPKRVKFHAEIDGHWTLLLAALEEEIVSIRNVTHVPESF